MSFHVSLAVVSIPYKKLSILESCISLSLIIPSATHVRSDRVVLAVDSFFLSFSRVFEIPKSYVSFTRGTKRVFTWLVGKFNVVDYVGISILTENAISRGDFKDVHLVVHRIIDTSDILGIM
jgi:hypothetical protein